MVINTDSKGMILTSDRSDIEFDPDSMLEANDKTVVEQPKQPKTKLNVQPFVVDSDAMSYKIVNKKTPVVDSPATETFYEEEKPTMPTTPEELSLHSSQPVLVLTMTTNGKERTKAEDQITLVCNLEQLSVNHQHDNLFSPPTYEYTVSILTAPILNFAISDRYLWLIETELFIKGEAIKREFETMPRLHGIICKDFEDSLSRCQLTFL